MSHPTAAPSQTLSPNHSNYNQDTPNKQLNFNNHEDVSSKSLGTSSDGTNGEPSSEGTEGNGDVAKDEDETDKLAPAILQSLVSANPSDVSNLGEGQTEAKPVDDTYDDLNFDGSLSDSDADADESPEADLDIADDDDDYDAIDKLSDTSEHSDNIENDAENDIFAEGELGIDWNDEQTYGFDDSWQASQYSLAAELQLGDSLPEDTLLLLDQARRMSAGNKTVVEKPATTAYVSSITFPDEWSSSEDEGGHGKEKPVVVKEEELTRRESQDTSASGQTNADSASIEGDDETDEEDIDDRLISSPGIAIISRSPYTAQSSPLSRRVSPSFPRKANRKAPVMRRIPVDPKKAMCSSIITSQGRVIQFNVPKKSYAIRWIMAGNSRSSSTASCPSKLGFRSTTNHIDSRTGSVLHDVINGRLFQQFHCNPLAAEESSPSSDVVRNPFLSTSVRPMYLRTPSRRHGVFEELDFDFDEEAHEDALNLIDFDGGDIDDDADSEEAADLARRSQRRHSAPAHSPNLASKGENPNIPSLDLDGLSGDNEALENALHLPKKRTYSNSSSALSPVVKKQRTLLEVPGEIVA